MVGGVADLQEYDWMNRQPRTNLGFFLGDITCDGRGLKSIVERQKECATCKDKPGIFNNSLPS